MGKYIYIQFNFKDNAQYICKLKLKHSKIRFFTDLHFSRVLVTVDNDLFKIQWFNCFFNLNDEVSSCPSVSKSPQILDLYLLPWSCWASKLLVRRVVGDWGRKRVDPGAAAL